MAKKYAGDVTHYKTRNLRCRGRNHPWKPTTDTEIVWKGSRIIEFTQILICPNCTSERHDKYDVLSNGRFSKKDSKIHYVDGYLLSEDNKFDRDDAADELVMRELSNSLNTNALSAILSQRGVTTLPPRLRVVGG